jgi:hypothetical protein
MQAKNVKVGLNVIFADKVFAPPYLQYFGPYRGHLFEVVGIHEGDHFELRCISDTSVVVNGCVHADQIKVGEITKPK